MNTRSDAPRSAVAAHFAEVSVGVVRMARCARNKIGNETRCEGCTQSTDGRATFFRHSPLTGVNDEKSGFFLVRYPGLRLLRSLALGCLVSLLRSFEEEGFFEARLAIRRGT